MAATLRTRASAGYPAAIAWGLAGAAVQQRRRSLPAAAAAAAASVLVAAAGLRARPGRA